MFERTATDVNAKLHAQPHQCAGLLAVISIGNELRGDDGLAEFVCNKLNERMPDGICYFHLGPYTSQIGKCLPGHHCAIVVDACVNSEEVIDLCRLLEDNQNRSPQASHALSFMDELSFLPKASLPPRLFFFAVPATSIKAVIGLSKNSQIAIDGLIDRLERICRHELEIAKHNA